MTRKEEILCATLELASEHGLKAVSMGRIAERIGIRKASLYNHFSSRDEIVRELYGMLRKQAQAHNPVSAQPASAFAGSGLEEILTAALSGYTGFLSDPHLLSFFRVLYSERSTSPTAAQIMLEETQRMIDSTRSLFYALVVHGKMKNADVDTAAVSYAMTIHSLIDRHMDRMTARQEAPGITGIPDDLRAYIRWFSNLMEEDANE